MLREHSPWSASHAVARSARARAAARAAGRLATVRVQFGAGPLGVGLGWEPGGGVVVDLDDDGNETFSARKVDALRGAVTEPHGARENVLVYLRRDVGYLVNRTSGDRNRPRLSDDVSFAKLMERRAPWYFRAADYVVDAAGGAVESRVKTKKAIKEEVLEYFYAETGGWPVDDDREQREERENGEETNGEETSQLDV